MIAPIFRNRAEAGRRLARALERLRGEAVVVLALARGGVPVGAEVARHLSAPLDLILARKIGAPNNPELALGAIADGVVVRNDDVIAALGVDDARFAEIVAREMREIERRRIVYLGGRRRPAVEGRVAVVVDDGVATGATTRAALRATRARRPLRLALATPIAPRDTLSTLLCEADETICLETPTEFDALGSFYEDFRQVDDAEVIALLDKSDAWPAS